MSVLLPFSMILQLLGTRKKPDRFLWTELIIRPIGARWREAFRRPCVFVLSVRIRLGWTPSGFELKCLLLGSTPAGTPIAPATLLKGS